MESSIIKRILALSISGLLALCAFSGCSSNAEDGDTDKHSGSAIKYGVPSIGIGRDVETETPKQPAVKTGVVICIDPGHGFVDGGCGEGIFDGVLEKDINLAIAKMLEEDLKNLGYTTIMTHDGVNIPSWDTNKNNIFSAAERVIYVNTLDEVDYLVSIHVNSNSDSSASGMWICYEQNARKINDWSEKIAKSMSAAMTANSLDVSKIALKSEYSLALTRETYTAASLIEIGFATNAADAARMLNPEWQSTLAQSIAEGIDDFFKGGDK